EVRVGGHDQLADRARADAGLQRLDRELFGPHSLQRSQSPEQDVVDAAEGPGPLQGDQVPGLLDDADQAGVSARVAAEGTKWLLGLGQIEAGLAVADAVLDVADRLGERE